MKDELDLGPDPADKPAAKVRPLHANTLTLQNIMKDELDLAHFMNDSGLLPRYAHFMNDSGLMPTPC